MSNIENEPKQVVFEADPEKRTFLGTLRTYFLTGLVVRRDLVVGVTLILLPSNQAVQSKRR